MSGEDIRLAHALVRKKSIGGFGIRPVLTGHRDTLPGSIGQLLQQRVKSLIQTLVHERGLFEFLIDPIVWRLIDGNSAPQALRVLRVRHATAPCVEMTRKSCISYVRFEFK